MAASDFGILLQTKFRMPVLHSRIHARERLHQWSDLNSWAPLTLVEAPAGYGKTTYLQQCAERLLAAGAYLAWVSYDREDDRADAALAYFVAAISHACPPISSKILLFFEAYREGNEIELMTAIINLLEDWGEPLVIILDDLHWLTRDEIHQYLQFFVRNLPSTARCILSSRERWRWNWIDRPLGDQLTVIDADMLRFTDSETHEYLELIHGATIEPGAIRSILKKTEGWIAAIQLLGASIDGLASDGSFDRLASGRSKIQFDQLADATLKSLSAEDLAFLLQVAPLGRFTAPLARHVTGLENAEAILSKIEAMNLFLIALDGSRTWFRFHALFREFLVRRLDADATYNIKFIHAAASEWFSLADLPIEATHHALLSGDLTQVSRLLDTAIPRLVRYSQRSLLVSWLEHVSPSTTLEISVNAILAVIWSHISAREFEKATALVIRTEEILSSDDPPSYAQITPKDRPCLELAKVAIQRYEEPDRDNSQRIRDIDKTLASNWYLERGIAEHEMGHIHWQKNDLERAYIAFLEARSQTETDSHLSLLVDSVSNMADIRLQQGRLRDSRRLAEEVLDRLSTQPNYVDAQSGIEIPAVGHARLILAEIFFEAGELAQATPQLEAAEALVLLRGIPELILRGRILRAEIDAAGLSAERRAARFLDIGSLPLHADVNDATNILYARQIWTQIEAGQMQTAEAILEKNGLPVHNHGPSPQFKIKAAKERLYIALSYYHIAAGNYAAALSWLRHLASWARQSDRQMSLARIHGLLAICYQQQNRPDEAMRSVREMMMIGEQHELFTTIASLSPRLDVLIQNYCAIRARQFDHHEIQNAPLYASRFMRSGAISSASLTPSTGGDPDDITDFVDDYVEPLTDREKEILQLIERGLKNQEIADELLIAITSVKWHNKNIFAKLDVRRRTQAIAKARSLKLLAS